MKKTIVLLIVIAFMFTCKKSEFNDLGGASVLKGVVVIYDTLNGMVNILPAKNYKVYIKHAGSDNGFLYSVTADAQAKFSFSGIDSSRSYTIYSLSDTGAIKYYGDITYAINTYFGNRADTIKLYPSQTNQNGIHVIATNEQMQAVPQVTVWVFNNPQLFVADSSAGRIFDMETNIYGVANRLNIPPGTYFLRAKTRIGNAAFAGEDTVVVSAIGIEHANLVMRTSPLPRNGIEAIVTDKYDTRVGNAMVYAYRSQLIFERDTVNFSNSLFSMVSNQVGLASAYMIEPGTYFLRAVKIINTDTLTKTASISVGSTSVESVGLKLE